MDIHIRHLRQLIVVAEELHFTRAADRLFVAQPALSASIRKLEASLELELFDRSTRSVQLTPEGREFLEAARAAVEAYDAAMSTASRLRGALVGPVRLGIHPQLGSAVRRAIVSRLREISADIELTVVTAGTAALMRDLRAGRLDAAIRIAPADAEGLDCRELARGRMVVVLPAGHPLAGRDRVGLTELRDEAWILPGDQTQDGSTFLQELCESSGFEMRVAPAVSDFDDGFSNVAAGAGIVVLPEALVGAPLPAGIATTPVDRVEAPVCFVTRPKHDLPLVDATREAVRRALAGFLHAEDAGLRAAG